MARKTGVDVYDWLSLGGFAMLEYGIASVSPAAAWITAGILVLLAASAPMKRKAN